LADAVEERHKAEKMTARRAAEAEARAARKRLEADRLAAAVVEPIAPAPASRRHTETAVETPEAEPDGAVLRGVTIFELRTATSELPGVCRWPVGDTQDDDFHFCGRPVPYRAPPRRNLPYCPSCAHKAYAPNGKRKLAVPDKSHSAEAKVFGII
jgi:hypothetical protein